MSDMHVLLGDSVAGWRVAMHFTVPNANNAVGVNYRAAIVNSGLGGITILAEGTGPGQISAAEKAQIEAGEVYEHLDGLSVDGPGQSTGGRQALLRQIYAATKAAVIDSLQMRLKFFGHTESEA